MVKKERLGIVVSNKAEKTIIVAIQRRYQHSKYSKTITKTKRYMAHDEENKCKSGDLVIIQESRPLSKNKRWSLKTVLKSYQLEN